MSFQAVKGTRDFYPEDMRVRNWILDAWRRVSLRNGFEEYDAPIFEYLDLFTVKSGDEIAQQLFRFTDRGGRDLAIRPEITPSLARMVNAKIGSLPRPIKWFSLPRVCRAENPQKGRLREFFQWNIDIIGADDVLADAECIFTCVDLLRELDLSSRDVVVRIGHRGLTAAMLEHIGIAPERVTAILPVLDKRPKVSDEEYRKLALQAGMTPEQVDAMSRFQDCRDLDALAEMVGGSEAATAAVGGLRTLFAHLHAMGVEDYCRLDLAIVRGLAYYTGVVYEIFDAAQSLRAVAGGGRYDNLLEVLGGPKVGATGVGMGDVVLGILLAEKNKIPPDLKASSLDFFVLPADESVAPRVLHTVARLRAGGWSADLPYKRAAVGKLFKEANRRNAAAVLIIEPDGEQLTVKNMASGQQTQTTIEQFLHTAAATPRPARDQLLP